MNLSLMVIIMMGSEHERREVVLGLWRPRSMIEGAVSGDGIPSLKLLLSLNLTVRA